jgi:hypothetical protein
MRTKLTDMVAVYVPGKRISWEAEVAEGMDLSLTTTITAFLAENMYNSSYPSPYSSNTRKPEDADPTDAVHTAPIK